MSSSQCSGRSCGLIFPRLQLLHRPERPCSEPLAVAIAVLLQLHHTIHNNLRALYLRQRQLVDLEPSRLVDKLRFVRRELVGPYVALKEGMGRGQPRELRMFLLERDGKRIYGSRRDQGIGAFASALFRVHLFRLRSICLLPSNATLLCSSRLPIRSSSSRKVILFDAEASKGADRQDGMNRHVDLGERGNVLRR